MTIRYVPKTKLVFVLDMRSLFFKESERKWRVGKKEKKKEKGKMKERTEEEESTRHRRGGLSLFCTLVFPIFV